MYHNRLSRQKKLAAVEREIANLVTAIAEAGWSSALRDRLQAAEAEREDLRQSACVAAPSPVVIPRLIEHYRRMAEELPDMLTRDPDAVRQAMRETFGEVELVEKDGRTMAAVELWGAQIELIRGASKTGSGGPLPYLSARRMYLIA